MRDSCGTVHCVGILRSPLSPPRYNVLCEQIHTELLPVEGGGSATEQVLEEALFGCLGRLHSEEQLSQHLPQVITATPEQMAHTGGSSL